MNDVSIIRKRFRFERHFHYFGSTHASGFCSQFGFCFARGNFDRLAQRKTSQAPFEKIEMPGTASTEVEPASHWDAGFAASWPAACSMSGADNLTTDLVEAPQSETRNNAFEDEDLEVAKALAKWGPVADKGLQAHKRGWLKALWCPEQRTVVFGCKFCQQSVAGRLIQMPNRVRDKATCHSFAYCNVPQKSLRKALVKHNATLIHQQAIQRCIVREGAMGITLLISTHVGKEIQRFYDASSTIALVKADLAASEDIGPSSRQLLINEAGKLLEQGQLIDYFDAFDRGRILHPGTDVKLSMKLQLFVLEMPVRKRRFRCPQGNAEVMPE